MTIKAQGADDLNLVAYISDSFGSQPTLVRNQLFASAIEIDGVEWKGDKIVLPRAYCEGKEIFIVGPDRKWRFTFKSDE